MNLDELFMQRAMELALLGVGHVSPNPRVGCVIVHNGKIVGEGWHRKYGEAHAEVNAIQSVKDQSILNECHVFVNLEPCSHTGKTPPCADLLIKHKIKRIIVSNEDPNPLVAGKGIRKLRDAGIQVDLGVLKEAGAELNKRFFTSMTRNRPYIILKWAETSDGFIARKNFDSKWISNEYARQLVHKWRTEEDGVLVGLQTAIHDNPKLTVRDWTGRNPTRIVVDRFLKLDNNLNLFDKTVPTICYNTVRDEVQPNFTFVRIDKVDFINQVTRDLAKRKIQSIIIEGGAQILQVFIKAGLWDEARVFTSNLVFDEGIQAPRIQGRLVNREDIVADTLCTYQNKSL